MKGNKTMKVLDCGHYPQKTEHGIGTGVTYDKNNKSMCYDCSYELEKMDLKKYDRLIFYVSSDFRYITNWTGKKLMKITAYWTVKHNMFYCSHLNHVQCEDLYGQKWYGKGIGAGMYIKLRKNKVQ